MSYGEITIAIVQPDKLYDRQETTDTHAKVLVRVTLLRLSNPKHSHYVSITSPNLYSETSRQIRVIYEEC